jgi:hypothetical protein
MKENNYEINLKNKITVYNMFSDLPLDIVQKIKTYIPKDKNFKSPVVACLKHVFDEYNMFIKHPPFYSMTFHEFYFYSYYLSDSDDDETDDEQKCIYYRGFHVGIIE